MQWFYVINGERAGPVSREQFDGLVQTGAITGATLVWHAGMAEWRSWARVADELAAQGDSAVCAVSGRVFPKREMLEYQGVWVSAEHKDVFFQRIREGLPPAGPGAAREVRYAGFWIRAVAFIIDYVCLYIMVTVISMVVNIFTVIIASEYPALVLISQFFMLLIIVAVVLGYNVFFTRKFDATPGKMLLGLKVLSVGGEKLSAGRIIGRFFAKRVSGLVFCIGYMMAGWDDQKRGLHDMICETRVVKK